MNALSPGIRDSKFHGEVRDVEAKGSQSTSHTLPLIIWLDNFEDTP